MRERIHAHKHKRVFLHTRRAGHRRTEKCVLIYRTEIVLTVLTFLTKRVFNVLIYFSEFVRPVLMCLTEPALAVLRFLTELCTVLTFLS
jgi:hypothetical protein